MVDRMMHNLHRILNLAMELGFVQAGKEAALFQEFGICPALDNLSTIHHQDGPITMVDDNAWASLRSIIFLFNKSTSMKMPHPCD